MVGVLIALSADAWIQARESRDDEIRHLEALRADFSQTRTLLSEWREQRLRQSSSLVSLLEEDLQSVASDSIVGWVYHGVWSIDVFSPRLTALRDIEASGEIRIVAPAIRRNIAEFNQRLRSLDALESDFTVSQQGLLDPFLVETLPLAPILARFDDLAVSERLPPRPDWSALRGTKARSLMASKLSLGKTGHERRDNLAEQLDLLLDLIDRRLGELDAAESGP